MKYCVYFFLDQDHVHFANMELQDLPCDLMPIRLKNLVNELIAKQQIVFFSKLLLIGGWFLVFLSLIRIVNQMKYNEKCFIF